MRKLAEKICTFMCGMDLYEAKDCYDSLEEFITETQTMSIQHGTYSHG